MISSLDFLPPSGSYEQVEVNYDPRQRAVWYTLVPRDRPCFNLDMLEELRQFQARLVGVVRLAIKNQQANPVRYTVLASSVPGIFNVGGDLQLFSRLIRAHDGAGLFKYAKACIDVLYPNAVNFDLPLTTITLVQGDALGGGFEAAISSNVIIAERGPKWGLPEVMFGLVPGMGAYSFLVRRIPPGLAERIIMNGEILTSDQMYDLNIIDRLVEPGQGEQAVVDFINTHQRRANAHAAMSRMRARVNPVTYEELIDITRIWVDAALQLGSRDLQVIERLIQAQNRRTEQAPPLPPLAMEGQA